MDDFERKASEEVSRLRAEAQKLTAEADALEGWLRMRTGTKVNGHGHAIAAKGAKQPEKTTKTGYFLGVVREAGDAGIARDDLFNALEAKYGLTRDRCRVMLWNITKSERVHERAGRIFLRKETA